MPVYDGKKESGRTHRVYNTETGTYEKYALYIDTEKRILRKCIENSSKTGVEVNEEGIVIEEENYPEGKYEVREV